MNKKKGPGRHERKGLTIIEWFEMFPNNETAEEWLEKQRWGDSSRCPACESEHVSKVHSQDNEAPLQQLQGFLQRPRRVNHGR